MGARLLIVQNNLDSPAGIVQEQAQARGIESTIILGSERLELPTSTTTFDGLLILGGTLGAMDDERAPYFLPLMTLARRMDERRCPVLGICLGAQLLARAWNGRIRPRTTGEYGFVPLATLPAAATDQLVADVPDGARFMQWHDDTYDLPSDATLLLQGNRCANQVWRIGNATYGFQPHIEVTQTILEIWGPIRGDLVNDPAAAGRLCAEAGRHLPSTHRHARKIADRFAGLVVAAGLQRA